MGGFTDFSFHFQIDKYGIGMAERISAQRNQGCPVCGSMDGHIMFEVNSSQAAQHFILKECDAQGHLDLQQHIASLWDGHKCEILRCSDCNFCYAWPFVAGDQKFYSLAYDRNNYPSAKWEYKVTIEIIRNILAKEQDITHRLIELGAGDGKFIERVSPELIANESVVCTEYSKYGAHQINKKDIPCFRQDIVEIGLSQLGGKFTIICLFQVLEHISELDRLFQKLNSIATPTAHLFLAVPSDRRMEFSEQMGGLLDMPPNHVGRWNKLAFEKVGDKYGWRLRNHLYEPETIFSRLKRHVKYCYLRKSQNVSTAANLVQRLNSKTLRTPLQATVAGYYAIVNIGSLIKLSRSKDLGNSQWVYLSRQVDFND